MTFFLFDFLSKFFSFILIFLLTLFIFEDKTVAYLSLLLPFVPIVSLGNWFLFGPGLYKSTCVLPFLLWSIYLFLQKKYNRAFLVAGLVGNLHILLAIYVMFMFLTAILVQTIFFKEKESEYTLLERIFSFGKISIKSISIFCIGVSPIILWVIITFGRAFVTMDINSWIKVLRIRYPHHISVFSWKRHWIDFISIVLLWSISIKYKPKREKHQIISGFMLAILTLCIIGFVFTEIFPSLTIIRLQLFRSTVFFIILSFPYICNYLWQSWENSLLQRTAAFSCIVGMSLRSNRVLWLVMLIFVAIDYGLLRNKKLEFFLSLVLVATVISKVISSPEPIFLIKGAALSILFLNLFLPVHPIFSKKQGLFSHSILLNASLVVIIFSLFNLYTRISIPKEKGNDWKALQVWCKKNTPKDALFIVPPYLKWVYGLPGFRVWSERSTLGDWKDGAVVFASAQFAAEWWNRMQDLGYTELNHKDGSAKEIYQALDESHYYNLAQKYGAEYAVLEKPHHLSFCSVYDNHSFVLLEIP